MVAHFKGVFSSEYRQQWKCIKIMASSKQIFLRCDPPINWNKDFNKPSEVKSTS